MNVLYLLKHFPCLSQTFVRHEVTELTARGVQVHVVSAMKTDDRIDLDPAIAARVVYLEHDYLYRYGTRAASGPGASLDRADDSTVPTDVRDRLRDILAASESDPHVRQRGFLDALRVARLIQDERIEHVHCDFAEDNVKLAFILHRAIGVPFTFKMRAYDIFAEPHPDVRAWADAAAAVVTISHYNRAYICDRWKVGRDKVVVIYDGVRLDQVPPVARYSRQPFRIVSAARLVEKKGLHVLLDACRLLGSDLPFTCDIFGDGPMLAALRDRVAEFGLERGVTLHGARPHEEVLAALESASAFVLPCIIAGNGDRDATPNSLLEAMARGIPVISTRVSGIPEIIEDGADGLLVDPGDAPALAEAIGRLAADGELADALRHTARQTVVERFRIERTVDEFLRLLPVQDAESAAVAS